MMKDGIYALHFVALDTDHAGEVSVHGNLVDGGDPIHAVRGQLSRAGANMIASFDVRRRVPDTAGETPGYTIKMFGSGTEQTFNLIGLAPLGLIVEMQGKWQAALPTVDAQERSNLGPD